MKRILLSVALVSLVLCGTASAQLGSPDPTLSAASSAGGQILICPAGDGPTLASVGATVTVTLVDATGSPVVGYPKENIRIESAAPGELIFCADGNFADADTDAMGMTTFSGTLDGAGCTQSGLTVVVGGMSLAGGPLPIDVNSVDMNGDFRVDGRDMFAFVPSFLGAYSFCADFAFSLGVNLGDLVTIYSHLCDVCPGGTPAPGSTLAGEIGVFFDASGTQTGIQGIGTGDTFDFYIVALSAPGGIAGYQFGLTIDSANVAITGPGTALTGGVLIAGGTLDPIVGLPGAGVQVGGPTVLASYQAFLTGPVTDSPICLGPAAQDQCGTEPAGPAYVSLADGEWRQFNQAYVGCAYINGSGPVTTEATSWSRVKAMYRD